MPTQAIQTNTVSLSPLVNSSIPFDENALEQVVGFTLLSDLNQQLTQVATSMRDQLVAKESVRSTLSWIESLQGRQTQKSLFGNDSVAITEQEKQKLLDLGFKNIKFSSRTDGNSGFMVEKSSLTEAIDMKKEELAGLNSQTELVALQIQSLVDQRKNAMSLLSNLLASRNETIMGIIRNLKN